MKATNNRVIDEYRKNERELEKIDRYYVETIIDKGSTTETAFEAFFDILADELDQDASQVLILYLAGYTQDEIDSQMGFASGRAGYIKREVIIPAGQELAKDFRDF